MAHGQPPSWPTDRTAARWASSCYPKVSGIAWEDPPHPQAAIRPAGTHGWVGTTQPSGVFSTMPSTPGGPDRGAQNSYCSYEADLKENPDNHLTATAKRIRYARSPAALREFHSCSQI
jgi:hypothetical protein